jgi:hypothetical protein
MHRSYSFIERIRQLRKGQVNGYRVFRAVPDLGDGLKRDLRVPEEYTAEGRRWNEWGLTCEPPARSVPLQIGDIASHEFANAERTAAASDHPD